MLAVVDNDTAEAGRWMWDANFLDADLAETVSRTTTASSDNNWRINSEEGRPNFSRGVKMHVALRT